MAVVISAAPHLEWRARMWLRIGSTPKPPSRGRPAKSDDACVEACGPVRV
jgi:hypothetical protein